MHVFNGPSQMQRNSSELFSLAKEKKEFASLSSINTLIQETSHIQNNIAKISNH